MGEIKTSFLQLMEHHTPLNALEYINKVKMQSVKGILEEAQHVFAEPTKGHALMRTVIETYGPTLDYDTLDNLKGLLSTYIQKAYNGGYQNNEHLYSLEESLRLVDTELTKRDDPAYIRDETVYKLFESCFETKGRFDDSFMDQIDRVALNIGDMPDICGPYLIRLDDATSVDKEFQYSPALLMVKHTSTVISVNPDTMNDDKGYMTKLLALPRMLLEIVMRKDDRLILAEALRAIIKKQMERVAIRIAQYKGDASFYQSFYDEMHQVYDQAGDIVKSRVQALQESIIAVSDDGIYTEGLSEDEFNVDDFDEDMMNLDEFDDDDQIDQDAFDENEDGEDAELRELLSETSEGALLLVENYTDEMLDTMFDIPTLERSFAIHFVNAVMGPEDEVNMESLNQAMQTAHQYDIALEVNAVRTAVRKTGVATDRGVQKTVKKIRTSRKNNKRAGAGFKKAGQTIDRSYNTLIDRTFGAVRKMDRDERRAYIIKGQTRTKLMRIVRTYIVTAGASWMIHPVVGIITLIATIARDRKLDKRTRNQIVDEMKAELTIVNEKIDDAKANNDKQKKYELMRIKNKLEKEIVRIQYNLKDMEAER